MTPIERKELIAKIRALPGLIESTVHALNDSQLDTPYRAGGWTPRQVVHHLVDSHMNAVIRMKLALTETKPTFKPYDQDEWARLADVRLPIAGSLGVLRGLHERWASLFDSLNEEQWLRSGMHPESGEMTLETILRTYAAHGEKHAGQIAQLRKANGW